SLDQYLEGGLPRLRRGQCHRPQSALAEHGSSLEVFFLQHPVRSAKPARAIIEQQTSIRRGLSQVRHFPAPPLNPFPSFILLLL
ncbi:MAG: hypothetical protein JO034_15770, partial [Singulisphaera sp.]|nr:hypothetical protein [Singulisphaera sp.]